MSPLKLENPTLTNQNINWNYNMGYRFTANVNGQITQLGGRWTDGVVHTVRLYSYPSGTLLASTNVTGSINWAYNTLGTAVNVTAGSEYVVAVRLNSQSSGCYSSGTNIALPINQGGITISNTSYAFGSNNMPTNNVTTAMYGQADITFVPCIFAGTITAGSEKVIEGDSTTLTVQNNIGSIQWQSSSDGVNFTDMPGATGIQVSSGAITSQMYFRTRTTSGGCGSDTSNMLVVSREDPFYPLRVQNPAVTGQNLNWNYNMGYRFEATQNGQVTELGGRWRDGVQHTVRLYAYPSGTVLATANVTGSMDWAYTSITPVNLTSGQQYVVAVRLNAQSSGTYSNLSTPQNSAGVEILNGTYVSSSNVMPTNSTTSYVYGLADMRFEPCAYAGLLSASQTSLNKWDSVTINLVNNIGSVQWQQSTDGSNFTNISGATGSSYNTGPLGQTMHYRTYVSGGGCSGDTSTVLTITVTDPDYPLQALNPPITAQNLNWNYNMGYRFTANANGNVTELGGRWRDGVTHTVRLYSYPSGSVLATTNVTGNGDWSYASISPVSLTSGQQYVVAVRLNSQSSGLYGSVSMPTTSGQITINGSCYASSTNNMPTNIITSTVYGQADIKFEPCVFAGVVSATDTLICPSSGTTLEVVDSEGSIQWQSSSDGTNFSNISGATDTVYNASNLAARTYYRVQTSAACGTHISNVVSIGIIGGGLHGEWTGENSTDWFDACNWADGQVPLAEDSVIVPSGTTPPSNMPNIILKYLELNIIGDFTLANDLTLTEGLVLNSGRLRLANSNLILNASATITGGQSTAYIQASGNGEIRKIYSSAGSTITIPVGDNSQFTPITFSLNSATLGSGAYFSFRSVDQNHPSLGTPTNRITRYWVVGGNNVSNFNYNVTLSYADIDIVGTESLIVARFLDPTNQWSSFGSAQTASNQLSATGVTQLGTFTGGDDLPFQSNQDGDWNTASTWSGGTVPGPTDDVTILPGHRVTVMSATTVRSVSVNNGGVIDLAGNDLNVEGDWSGYGQIDGNGSIVMNGTSAQQISGTTEFGVLEIDNSAGVAVVAGSTSIRTRLEITTGNFNAGGRITLISDASGTASIGEITGSLSGTITSQRHISAVNSVDYRHISTPIANSTLNDIKYDATNNPNGMYFYGFSGSNNPSAGISSCFYFNEAAAGSSGSFNDGWQAPSSIGNSNNYLNVLSYYSGGPNFSSYDFSLSGAPNQGNITLSNLSFTGGMGWHLIGNPYPSSIDWNQVSLVGVDAVGYVFTGGGYVATNLLSPSNYIAQYQGFFVHVNSATNSISFQENDKVDTDAAFRKAAPLSNRFKLSLKNLGEDIVTYCALDFKQDATLDFDGKHDAYIIGNPGAIPDLGFAMGGDELQVSAVPAGIKKLEVPLITRCHESGQFELHVDQVPEGNFCMVLYDKKENTYRSLSQGDTIRFSLTANENVHRYVLQVSQPYEELYYSTETCQGKEDGDILLSNVDPANWSLSVFDLQGNSQLIEVDGHYQKAKDLAPGIYKTVVSDVQGQCESQTEFITITEAPGNFAAFEVVNLGADLAGETEVSFYNQSEGMRTIAWMFGDGESSNETNPTHIFKEEGVYTVSQLALVNAECYQVLTQEVVVSGNTLSADMTSASSIRIYDTGLEWVLELPRGEEDVRLDVMDVNGKVLESYQWERLEAGEHRVAHESWSQGLYLYQYHSSESDLAGKIIQGK
ncbi:DUF4082 domain-containing protein [bacterium SCSIO 12741]|nr:DUF4082 domain-containing protein [bacterium SCSIO 12741]